MQKGYSGAKIELRDGALVKQMQWANDEFLAMRPKALLRLCRDLDFLPTLRSATETEIVMDFIDGHEGFSATNASAVGNALRCLHAYERLAVPIANGFAWVLSKANQTLQAEGRANLPSSFIMQWPSDATVHGEPVQVIEKPDGKIVFIDIDGIGRGSRYQDLGYIKYRCDLYESPEAWVAFIEGYNDSSIEPEDIDRAGGLLSLAYAFYDRSKRVQYGLRQLGLE